MTKVADASNAGVQDLSRDEMSSYQMLKVRGGSVNVRQKVDGSIESNVWHPEGTSDEIRAQVDGKLLEYKNSVDELRQQAAQAQVNGQPNLADELEFQADKLEKLMNQFKNGYEKLESGDVFARQVVQGRVNTSFNNIDTSVMTEIRTIQQTTGVDAADSLTPMMVIPDPEPIMGNTIAGEKPVSEMTDEEKSQFTADRLSDPHQLVSDFESNPKEFFGELAHLDSNDRQSIIMTLQTQIQADNQLYSTLSNFIKAMHDTEKAAIANLRV